MRVASIVIATAIGASASCGVASATRRVVPPHAVVAQVRASIARCQDSRPTRALFVLTRRQAANEVLSGASVNSNRPVYVVVVEGSFTVDRPGSHATGLMHVTVLDYVFDARTGRETDGGFGRALPDVRRLGRVDDLLPYLRHG